MRGSIDFEQNGQNDLRDSVRYLGADTANGRDVDYVMADVTRAYSSTRFKDDYNTAKVSEVVRQLVYFRVPSPGAGSDYVVVFDRATATDTKFEKRWLFHSIGRATGQWHRYGRPTRPKRKRCRQVDVQRVPRW